MSKFRETVKEANVERLTNTRCICGAKIFISKESAQKTYDKLSETKRSKRIVERCNHHYIGNFTWHIKIKGK